MTTTSEYLFGIFKSSLETFVHDLFYTREIRGRVYISSWNDIGIMCDNLDIYS